MKNICILIIILLMLPSLASATGLKTWDIAASINDDESVDMDITLVYAENVTKTDYFVLARISHVGVYADGRLTDCEIQERDIGTLIICNDIRASRVEFQLKAHGIVESYKNFNILKYKFPVIQATNEFSVLAKLPMGAVIAEADKLTGTGLKPFEPESGNKGSDGRLIYVQWKKENPKLGEMLDVSIIYEKTSDLLAIFSFIFIPISVIAIVAIVWVMMVRKPFSHIMPVLTPDERKVVEILLKEKKPVDQKILTKELDCSKSKMTRLIKNLEERGMVQKISRGRSNKIRLVKSIQRKEEPMKEGQPVNF